MSLGNRSLLLEIGTHFTELFFVLLEPIPSDKKTERQIQGKKFGKMLESPAWKQIQKNRDFVKHGKASPDFRDFGIRSKVQFGDPLRVFDALS